MELGWLLQSPPAVVSWGADRLDIFVIGSDDGLYHKAYDGAWQEDWESLGGGPFLTTTPVAVSRTQGSLDVLVQDLDTLYGLEWYGSGWSDWWTVGTFELSSDSTDDTSSAPPADAPTDDELSSSLTNGGTTSAAPAAEDGDTPVDADNSSDSSETDQESSAQMPTAGQDGPTVGSQANQPTTAPSTSTIVVGVDGSAETTQPGTAGGMPQPTGEESPPQASMPPGAPSSSSGSEQQNENLASATVRWHGRYWFAVIVSQMLAFVLM